MKQTAVEWLLEQINPYGVSVHQDLFEQAKEMEKQQQGYSEEEVIELLTQRSKHFGTSLSPFDKILLKQDLEWFEQYKKK